MRNATSAEAVSAKFRSNEINERLYRKAEIKIDLTERMISMRHESGLSQQQLADRVGRKQPFIARLERGGYNRCGIVTLRTLARAMNFDIHVAGMFAPN